MTAARTEPIRILAPTHPSTQSWPDLAARDLRRILIIKPSAVGDIARTLPVLTALRRRWPHAHIAWLVASHCAGILAGHPAIDEVISFDRKAYANLGRSLAITRAFGDFLHRLRQGSFDMVIDFQGLFRSGFFAAVTGAAVRIGRADGREMTGLFYTHRAAVDERRMHAFVLNCGMIAPLGLKVEPSPGDLYISPEARSGARRALQEAGLAETTRYAVIAPGSNWQTKDWPAEKFGEVAAGLRQRFDLRSVVVGTGGQKAMADAIRRVEPTAIDLCGRSNLAELVAVIEEAVLLVANDSGPLHIADALDMPLVGVFGPTRPEVVGPFKRVDGVIRTDVPCLCCGIRKLARCPHGHRCMDALSPDAVVDLAARQLQRPAGAGDPR